MIKLQTDGSIIKSYEWFSKSRKIPKQQDYLQKDSFNRKAPWEQGLKLHNLPQQLLVFSFNYPMTAKIKTKNATGTTCMGQIHVLTTQYWNAQQLLLTTPIQTQKQHLPYMHGFQEPLHSFSNTCNNITVKSTSCHTTKIIITPPPFYPCPVAKWEGSGRHY